MVGNTVLEHELSYNLRKSVFVVDYSLYQCLYLLPKGSSQNSGLNFQADETLMVHSPQLTQYLPDLSQASLRDDLTGQAQISFQGVPLSQKRVTPGLKQG